MTFFSCVSNSQNRRSFDEKHLEQVQALALIGSFRPALLKALVETLSALESRFDGMPVINFCFPQLPTEQHDLLSDLAGEIQQAFVEILHLDANRVDFLDCILGLLDRGALGIVTTHDLALTEIAQVLPGAVHNVHFQDYVEEGKMRFDHKLHDGVVAKSNALELMRLIGLKV